MTNPTVLVVDDNSALRETIRENLELDGYTVFNASSGAEAMKILKVKRTDTILLDLMLPDADGLTLIAQIRALTDAPVIVISGKGAWVDKVVGLEMGADDYLAKPFEMKELSARVKAAIRRSRPKPASSNDAAPRRTRFAEHILDTAKYQVFDDAGKSCELTPMEFRLLEALVHAPNRVLSREQLLDRAREGNLEVGDRAIDIQIARIRKKLGGGEVIQTVRGVGYSLNCDIEDL
ncbi:MAG: two component transcriptional regulator, winged helix family [Alphaproteobacteria bacterium]|nr:two component transcriptional regulator, winged helix family [Alphaproteobacteria bacterium]